MERLWSQLQRPLLIKVVAAYDCGRLTVDPYACAADLGEPADRIKAALAALQVAGFLETQPHHGGMLITRICPLARQIIGADTTAPAPDSAPDAVHE
ncbi:hypothetical protein [Catellatospora sp. NPDC049111]|jgi:hypothetical protein|uniref:hypothetical protein n=1 Tax=unclassified Catellatospora TaxID=2645785 RepID=UPI0034109290